MNSVGFVNPLPRALSHYERELTSLFSEGASEGTLERVSVRTAELGTSIRARKLLAAAGHLRALRALRTPFIELWPVTGHLEALGTRSSVDASVIFHDPDPIRRQFGYDPRSIRTGVARANATGLTAIVHSRAAEERIRELGYRKVRNLPHPMLEPRASIIDGQAPVIRVLGQFKPTRDVDLLARLGPLLRHAGIETEIIGRGWPLINGWHVRDEFVTEAELDALIEGSAAVLIPYSRYWQSGIAVRALERGVSVVGASNGFLTELLGEDAGTIVSDTIDPSAWLTAALAAVGTSRREIAQAAFTYHHRASAAWQAFVAERRHP
ncbi:hypothetical protein P2A57_22815 [Xanthomonas perforans]